MEKIKIQIASVPDRDKLVAEMWFLDNLIAEINQEGKSFEIELYISKPLKFSLKDFKDALATAEIKLLK